MLTKKHETQLVGVKIIQTININLYYLRHNNICEVSDNGEINYTKIDF